LCNGHAIDTCCGAIDVFPKKFWNSRLRANHAVQENRHLRRIERATRDTSVGIAD